MMQPPWNGHFTKDTFPLLRCVCCSRGVIILDKQSIRHVETSASQRQIDPDGFDDEFSFTAWAKCSNPDCNQEYALSGVAGLYEKQISDDDFEWDALYEPKSCFPMPDIFELPRHCPTEIAKVIRSTFPLFLIDTNSCAGRIRTAIELLLDHQEISRKVQTKKGKQRRAALHQRIELFQDRIRTRLPKVATYLAALKTLGNFAAHQQKQIPQTDILKSFEILQLVLNEVFGMESLRLDDFAQDLANKYSGE